MKRNLGLLILFAVLLMVFGGCSKNSAADALKKAACDEIGIICDAPEGVDTPAGWTFLFAKDLSEAEALAIDQSFEISIKPALEFLGVSEDDLNGKDFKPMIAFAKVEEVPGYGSRLRYANKLKYESGSIKLDTEALDQLGDSIGSSGAGIYAAYFSSKQNGYISGKVTDCDGNAVADILATASDGPFFTMTAGDGSWALPNLTGKSATINFAKGDCAGSTSAPSTDTNTDPNPKNEGCGTEGNPPCAETPPTSTFADGTGNVDGGKDNTMDPTPPEIPAPTGGRIDFEDGSFGDWQYSSGCQLFGVESNAYSDLFPDGTETRYLYLSTGGNNVQSCTMTLTVPVPSGMSKLEISYNFVSQEYSEWVGSAYNDLFTVIVQGGPAYLVNRSVNNVATDNDWMATTEPAKTIAGVADSLDAQWNDHPNEFDGMLKWTSSADTNPRGAPVNNNQGKTAIVPLPSGMDTITIIATVSDVADAIYDSAGLIDWIAFTN